MSSSPPLTSAAAAPATARGRRPPHRTGDDRGSISVELALSVPLVVLLLFLVIGAINVSRANLDVHAAATAAARAGSLARTPSAATAAAHDAATVNLTGHCTAVTVTADTSQFHRGGQFTVTIGCTVTTQRLTGVGVPGRLTVTATSTSPLDRYRSEALSLTNPETPATSHHRLRAPRCMSGGPLPRRPTLTCRQPPPTLPNTTDRDTSDRHEPARGERRFQMNANHQQPGTGPAGDDPVDDDAEFAAFVALFAADVDDPVNGAASRDFLDLPVEEQRAYFDLTNALAQSQPDLPPSAVMTTLLLAAVLIAAVVFITPAVLDVVLR